MQRELTEGGLIKYPTRSGLAIPVYELYRQPTTEDLGTRRRTTNHHAYWPHDDYREGVHRVFRALTTHVQPLLIEEHQELHEDYNPPVMPKLGVMIDVIEEYLDLNGQLDLVREKRTNETYPMCEGRWRSIRG